MKNGILFGLSIAGVVSGLAAAYLFGQVPQTQPPLFKPAQNPFAAGIYTNGIVESAQANGQNVNIYPEVSGTVLRVLVHEGESVRAGAPLLALDDAIQAATVAQQKAQMEAAATLLAQLKAQPRGEALAVAQAQLVQASASQRSAQDQFDKQRRSYDIEPRSVSMDALDNARNALAVATAAREVAARQYELTRAGAWSYDIRNGARQADAAARAYEAGRALLARYTLRAPVDGVVMAVNTAAGNYVSPQGVYSTYTNGSDPAVVMSAGQNALAVRCFIDEILISRLPPPERMLAQMSVRGTNLRIPLQFVRVQPYVSPKIQLSNQRQERVDLRVLPVIFRFVPQAGARIYPGQLVDVYIGGRA
jgi:HlyD family secretion protein